ncbi:MAG TPA: hypothetical protein VGR61_06640 [Candidatus Dormibacteraeota bacterium]|nr:hypothetical protein [Candidatus Dormibacteraeota bacterium]
MLAPAVVPVADAFTGAERLQLVAVLLGILVFGIVVLIVERRNSSHEAAPPGLTGVLHPPAPPRQVYRPPANAVPVASARDAAESPSPDAPYPVPFLDPAPNPEGESGIDSV